nr:VOC family protein [Sphingomonas sp. Y57]
MSITGIESLVYGVDDVATATRFFEDFGLPIAGKSEASARFVLAEGSSVVLLHRDDPVLPVTTMVGGGVREIIWGVDSAQALDAYVERLRGVVEVRRDDDGTAHFVAPFGVAMGLRLWRRKPVLYAPDPVNAPGRVNRFNQHRKWRERARPKVISHAVWAIPDFEAGYQFMRDMLDFRLADRQRGVGVYLRADGSNNHHSIFFINANAPTPGMDGQVRFHHANFGVEDIDEIMTGANHMVRKGWEASHWGLGRHRIDSALFYYIPCPAGGEAEYGADSDYIDDSWVPRDWTNPLFGVAHYMHNLPPFLIDAPEWEFRYLTEETATAGGGH